MKKRRYNYAFYAVMAGVILLTLFFDTFQPRSIETVAVISGMGLEKGEEKRLKLSVQIIRSGSNANESNASSCIVMTAEGDTVAEACKELVLKTGSVLFWSHCAVMVIQEELAMSEDVVPHLDMFFRSTNFRNTSAVIVYDGSPEEVFSADTVSETISAFGVRRLMDDQEYESNCVYTTLKRFIKDYYSPGNGGVVTGIDIEDMDKTGSSGEGEGAGSTSSVVLAKTAAFKNGRMVGYLDDGQFNGYKWLSGTMKSRTVVLDGIVLDSEGEQENTVAFTVFGAGSSVRPMYENGEYVLVVDIEAKAEMISIKNELQSVDISLHKLKNRFDELAEKLSRSIIDDIEAAWQGMKTMNCDYCGIQDDLYSYLGKKWSEGDHGDGWILDNVRLEYNMDITVVSGGLNKRYKLKG